MKKSVLDFNNKEEVERYLEEKRRETEHYIHLAEKYNRRSAWILAAAFLVMVLSYILPLFH